MKPLNSSNRQLKLSLIWLVSIVAMIPVHGFCISTIWNWFMPIIGLPTVTWMQAYCLLFAIKTFFGINNESEITKDIKGIVDGTCTEYDALDIPDETLIIILTIMNTIITSGLYLIIGWLLSYFLYL